MPARAEDLLKALWALGELPDYLLPAVSLTGNDLVMPSSFAVAAVAKASLAASASAAAAILRQRGGPAQTIGVDALHALVEFRSERYLLLDGQRLPEYWEPISGRYLCRDGRWILVHANLPQHREPFLSLLGCDEDRSQTEQALAKDWTSFDFEEAAVRRGAVVAAIRTLEEWDAHPHSKAVLDQPLISIERIGDAPRLDLPKSQRPLEGLRVLELTKVIAGPSCGRILAGHGAEVLLLTRPDAPTILPLAATTGLGKRAAELDLKTVAGIATVKSLLQDADVFLHSVRPGSLERLALGAEEVAKEGRGKVVASVSAFGEVGPWGGRRGFDSIVQAAVGFNHSEGEASGTGQPTSLPVQALDYATGNLLAFGILVALHRRMTVGGSWSVRVALARTAAWLREAGRVDSYSGTVPPLEDVMPFMTEVESGFGKLTLVRPSAILSETPMRWTLPSVPPGTHPALWAYKNANNAAQSPANPDQ